MSVSTPGRANAAPPSGPRLRARGTPLAQHIASWPSLISLPRTTGRPLLLSFQSDSLAAHSVFVCSAPILSYKLMPVRLSTYIICMVKYGATIVHVKPIYIFANESLSLCLCLCLSVSVSLSVSLSLSLSLSVCVCARARALKIVSVDKILRFTNIII